MLRPGLAPGILFGLVILLSACGGGKATPSTSPTSEITPVADDLSRFVGSSLDYVQAYSEDYVIPSATELDRFDALVVNLVERNIQVAEASAGALNFELIRFTDTGAGGNEMYCLREVILRGQGFYCVDYDSVSAHHVSVPHPLYDAGTHTASVTVMRGVGARFLSVSTSHRCANSAVSSCSGTTAACGAEGAYKVSDAAHNVDAFFYRFGVNVHDRSAATHTLQLHGCSGTVCPSNYDGADIVARLSAGTTNDLPGDQIVNRLTSALNVELAPFALGEALSCSEPGVDKQFCGTANPLGRHINGQPDSCQNAASNFQDSRWLHIEQNRNLRADDGAGDEVTPDTLVRALGATIEP